MKALLLLLAAVTLCSGCTSMSVRKLPNLDLNRYQHFFVVQPFNENHHIDEIFAEALQAKGKTASSGPMTMMPESTEVVISYDARWTWDFKTYLIELNFEAHTAHTRKKLAEGRYFQPTARPRPPERAVRDLVAKLLAAPEKQAGSAATEPRSN